MCSGDIKWHPAIEKNRAFGERIAMSSTRGPSWATKKQNIRKIFILPTTASFLAQLGWETMYNSFLVV